MAEDVVIATMPYAEIQKMIEMLSKLLPGDEAEFDFHGDKLVIKCAEEEAN